MPTASNLGRSALVLPTGRMIEAGQTVDLDSKEVGELKKHKVAQAWIDAGRISIDGSAPVSKPASKPAAQTAGGGDDGQA